MNRRLKATLTISVALNLLLAGMLLGDVSRHLITPPQFDVSTSLRQLPQDKRNLFESIMGPAKQKMDVDRKQLDHAKAEAIRLLKLDSFSEDAYLTQISHISDIHAQMKEHIAEAIAKLAKQLTPQEREILADIVTHPPFALPIGAMQQQDHP